MSQMCCYSPNELTVTAILKAAVGRKVNYKRDKAARKRQICQDWIIKALSLEPQKNERLNTNIKMEFDWDLL